MLIQSASFEACSYTTDERYGIFGKHNGNTRIWHFDLLEVAWHQPQTHFVAFMQFSYVVLWTKMECAISEIRYTQRNLQECIFLIPRMTFPTASRVYIITVWISEHLVCIQSLIPGILQHLRRVGKQSECLTKTVERCVSRYSILSFSIITKLCFISIKHVYLKLRTRFLLISVNRIYTLEVNFR